MTEIRRYSILTPFNNVKVVAGICALHSLAVQVCMTSAGVIVFRNLPVPVYDEWDIRQITGELPDNEPQNPSDNGALVAALLSSLSPYGVVLMDVNVDDSEEGFEPGVSGMVRARRFLEGEPGEEIASGLLLNGLDLDVENIVVGEGLPEDLDTISTADVTREDIEQIAGMLGEEPTDK